MSVNVLGKLSEQQPEQIGQQRSGQIQPLLAEMITIVQVPSFELCEHEPMNHITEEVSLGFISSLFDRDMGERLFGENVFGVADTFVLGILTDVTTTTDLVEGTLEVDNRNR
jgi:hypothetical protein